MATDRQIRANQSNALKSTGPTTPEGKAISSRNSLKHGILTRSIIENAPAFGWHPAELQEFIDDLRAEIRPVGAIEEMYFHDLLRATLRLPLVLRYEARQARRDEDLDFGAALGIEELSTKSDFEFVEKVRNRDQEYLSSLKMRLNSLLQANEADFFDAVLSANLPGFIVRSLRAPLPEFDLKTFGISSEESKRGLSGLVADYRLHDWRAENSLEILRSRVIEVLHIVQNAESLAAQEAPAIDGRKEGPRPDLMARYERRMIKIRRDAIRFFAQRRKAQAPGGSPLKIDQTNPILSDSVETV